MKKTIKFIIEEVLYNGHLQTFGSVGIVLFAAIIFGINISFLSIVIVYVSFYLIYLFNRYKEFEIDYATNKERSEHIKKMLKFIPWIVLILSLIFLGMLFFTNIAFSLYMIFITVFGFFYTSFFKKLTRYVFLFKNIYVALVFSLLIAFPFFYNNIDIGEHFFQFWLLAILVFVKAMAMQIVLDLKDIKSDKKEKLKTLGVLIGTKKSLSVFIFLSIFSSIIMPIFYYFLGWFSWEILLLTPVILFNLFVLRLVKNGKFAGFLLEGCEFIFWPILIVIKFLL